MPPDNAPSSGEVVRWELDGGTARLHINHAAKRNARATVHLAALESCLDEIHASTAKLLVLEGVPGAFSAGADIDELGGLLTEPGAFATSNAQVQRTQLVLQRSPLTTVAAIDGACVGDGLGLALACDFRIATTRSRFALSPGWCRPRRSHGCLQRCLRQCRRRRRCACLSGQAPAAVSVMRLPMLHA